MGELCKAGDEDSPEVRNFKKLFCENYGDITRLVKQMPEAEALFYELRGQGEWPESASEMATEALIDFEDNGNTKAVCEAFMALLEA